MNPLTTLFGAKTGSPPKSASLDLERLEERLLLSWTFMVYVDGDNNLEDAAIDDFLEMSGIGSTADVNVVVQMDRIPGYDTRYGDWTGTRQGLVSSGDVPDASWGTSVGEVNMGSPDTLTAFATWAIGAYPADNYALILWDHGGGWRSARGGTRDCCWDDTSGSDYLANNEVRGALEAVPTNIDLLGFDACLMGMIETAYEMRNEATVLVASEETEPWDGWPYDTILADLVTQPTMDAASLGGLIAYRYYESYGPGQWVTQSATDLSAVVAPGGLADSVSNLATVIMATANASDYTALQTHRLNSATYWDAYLDPFNVDLGDFLAGVAGDATMTATISAAASTALTAYNDAIISSYADPGWGTGLSIYFQDEGVSPDFGYNGSTIDFPVDTQWDEFLAWWENGPSATEGSISGSKWEDTNGDGTWDAGEAALEGWTIFLDQNQNGVLDGGETSTATGSYGFYAFSGLSAGTYYVAEVLQTGWEQTFPTGGTHTVALSAGESMTGMDFGNRLGTGTAEIHGSKWEDLNGDGGWGFAEPTQAGWTIYLDQNQNGLLDGGETSVVTGEDGSYSFTALPAGTYYVAEVLRNGWQQTFPTAGTHTVSLSVDEVVTGRDFGNVRVPLPGLIEQVSVSSAEVSGNGDSRLAAVNSDGRFVAFESYASNLVAGDVGGRMDVFVRDRETGTTELVSLTWQGEQANGSSGEPAISSDGRYVAFHSLATNLVQTDDNGYRDVFVYDRQTGTVELVSVSDYLAQGDHVSGRPAISADGRYVVFESQAENLVGDDTNSVKDIFVHDRQTGTTERVSVASGGQQGDGISAVPDISADGRYVVFESLADNLEGDTAGLPYYQVFMHDRQAGTTWLISDNPATGDAADDHCNDAAISADGRYVTFHSTLASTLVPGVTGGVFVYDRQSDTIERLEIGGKPDISADGRFVTYRAFGNVLLYDRQSSESFLLGSGDLPVIGGDGEIIAYERLVQSTWQVFAHDRSPGAQIQGSKWQDDDGNGVWDAGEPGLAGWTIFLDQNQNGVLDGGETSTLTGSDGSYSFIGLDAGTYYVAEVLQTGWTQTYPVRGSSTTVVLPNGTAGSDDVDMVIIDSPPTPPPGHARTVVDAIPRAVVMLDGVPTSTWTYGCSATSAGMIFGYYDRHGYPNMYVGPTNGGVAPLTDLGQGNDPANPIAGATSIIATQNGFDGSVTNGHVDDYWIAVGAPGPDPWEGSWTEHTWADCTADFMGTNQWKWDFQPVVGVDGIIDSNIDGATTLWLSFGPDQLVDYVPDASGGLPQTGLSHGLRLFAESRGYEVEENYSQRIDALIPGGFSFDDYMAEIDGGYPVMIYVEGHSMVGVGYDDATQTVYLHDTWDNDVHSMTWGGDYAGMAHVAMTVIHLEPGQPGPGHHVVDLAEDEIVTDINFGNQSTAPVNDPPVLTTVDILTGASEDTPFDITYLMMANAGDESDPDGDTVSFRVESITNGTLTEGGVAVTPGTSLLDPGETWVWQGPTDANGLLAAFRTRAWDGQAASASDVQVSVQVAPVNDAPTLTAVATLTGALTEQDFTITYGTLAAAANEYDVEGNVLSFRVQSVTSGTLTEGGSPVVPGATLLSPGENLVWNPGAGVIGDVDAFTVVAWDGLLPSSPDVQVRVSVNNAPTLTTIDTLTGAQEDTQFQITYVMLAAAADEDDLDGDTVSFRLEAVTGGILTEGGLPVVAGAGLLEPGEAWDWAPPLDANGTLAAFTVRAWDSEAASATPVQVRVEVDPVNDAPQIVALADAPDPVTRPAALTLTALGVDDVDGTVAAVEFYRDGNGNGTFDDGVDVVLGQGVQDGADWAWSDSTAGWPLGTFTYFARAQDGPGAWSEAVSTGGTVQNSVPVVGLLADEPDPVYRPDDLTLTATGVGDVDGAVARAEFYRDANGNGVLDPTVDVLLGIDLNEADGWTWSGSTAGWAPGAHTYFVRVRDDDGAWSGAASATGTIPNLLPGVGSLSDSPDPIVRPGTLMLTAADVQDPDGSVVRVAFYRDANGNGTLEPGTDVLLGEDTIAANGWSWSGLTTGWPAGTQTYFARPQDNDGGWGDAALTTGTIQNAPPVVGSVADSPDPVTRPDALTLRAEGAGDVDGFITLAEFYRDANGNATFEPDLDLPLGSDGSAVGGWSWSGSTLGWPVGDHTYFVRVRDNDGTWSGAVAAAGTVRNAVPTVASMSDTPDPVTRPAAATLSAAGVADRDGQIVRVEFYLDTNRNGALEIGSDALLGEDTQGADGWRWSGGVALWPLGSYGAFARAQDDDGAWSAVVSTAVTVQNALPAVGSLAQTPGEVARPDLLTLTASDVVDPDGTVQRVEFYRDANGNGVLDPASDLLLGIDANGANGWGWNAVTTAWPLGEHVYFARAHDSDAAWGGAAAAIGVVSNAPPVIVALADGPDPVTRSEVLTLDAQGVNDPDGSISMVEFYRDADGDGELDPGTDTLLSIDTDGGDGWSWSGSTQGWLVGTDTYLARARDDDAEWSAVFATTGSVQNAPPVVASLAPAPDPVGVGQILTLTAEGVADADGAVTRVEFYLDNDGVPGLNAATDELAGVGVDTGGGVWELGLDTRGWALGTNAYVARAQDDDGDWSGVAGTEVRVGYTLVESQVVDRATISFYDVDASNGVISPEVIEWSPLHYGLSSSTAVFVNLGFFGDGVIDSILLLGNGNVTADLGIVVEDNLALGTVVDVRTAPQPLQFLVSEGAVNYVSLLSGVAGGSLNGFITEAGWSLAADIDGDGDTGDRTGLYSGGRLGVVIARGSVAGDIVAGGNLDYLQVNGGDLNGDVVLTASDLGTIVTIGGDMAGNVMAPVGSIGSLIAVNGNIDLSSGRQIRARSSISAVHAVGGSILGGGGGGITVDDGHLWSLYTSGDLTADVTAHGNLGVVSVGGSVRNASIWADGSLNTLYALGDFHNTNVRATRLGVVYVGGEITEEDSDGEDEIRALEARFFVLDSQKSAWITPGSPVEFGGVTAWVG